MPVIMFEGPKMTREQKEELVRNFATVASRITNIPQEAFVTLIRENNPENVGVGTGLLIDKLKVE
ncbi:MAG: tautomerase family protein [Heliobacteriaceae bacterium]|nr:tautomerase family protein [Heliobacteriaceae bacterium]MDD4587258.1 tautomerase family protein [Heliobacteriaceae bacterium]